MKQESPVVDVAELEVPRLMTALGIVDHIAPARPSSEPHGSA